MKNKILKILSLLFFIFLLNILSCNITKGYEFENDIKGSTGWGTINLNMRESANDTSNVVATVPTGKAFFILSESGNYWQIEYDNKQGYVEHGYCMINLPDVMPSIVYNITNASSSIYKSSGYNLPDVTGTKLYSTGKVMNNKIGREEYPCPILYSTAKKIADAQKNALKDGYCLKIYDSYRPYSVSKLIAQKLNIIYSQNITVKSNINYSTGKSGTYYYWGPSWFLAQGLSSHNTGAAIDVTLCYNDTKQECSMPTAMHELSTKAIKYYSGSCTKTPSNYSKEMTADAQKLDRYMTDAGMSTLSSEWWHFQEQEGYRRIKTITNSNGCDFQVENIVSEPDVKVSNISFSQEDTNNLYFTVTFNKEISNISKESAPKLKIKIVEDIIEAMYDSNTNNSITYKISKNVIYEGKNVEVYSLEGGSIEADLTTSNEQLGTVSYTAPKINHISLSGIDDQYVDIKVYFDKNIMVTGTPSLKLQIGNNIKYQDYYEISNDSITFRTSRLNDVKVYSIKLLHIGNSNEVIYGGTIVSNDSGSIPCDRSFSESEIITMPSKDSIFDVNEDGIINAEDASSVLSHYANVSAGNIKPDKQKYDVNGNGKVEVEDAILILSYYAKMAVTQKIK